MRRRRPRKAMRRWLSTQLRRWGWWAESVAESASRAVCPHRWMDMNALKPVTHEPFTYHFCPDCGRDDLKEFL